MSLAEVKVVTHEGDEYSFPCAPPYLHEFCRYLLEKRYVKSLYVTPMPSRAAAFKAIEEALDGIMDK